MTFDYELIKQPIKSKEEYAVLYMNLVKEGYEEFLYRGLEPKGSREQLTKDLEVIKKIISPEEWNTSKEVRNFKEALNQAVYPETELSLASSVKAMDFDEIVGIYVLKYYDDLDEAVDVLTGNLERMENKGKDSCDFAYTRETLQVLKILADYDREFTLEN